MSTFEEVAAERKWLTGWSFQEGELYAAIEAASHSDIDVEEVLSLAVAYLMEAWDETDKPKRITRKLWTAVRDAVRDVAGGLQWEPADNPRGFQRGRPIVLDTTSLDALAESEEDWSDGDVPADLGRVGRAANAPPPNGVRRAAWVPGAGSVAANGVPVSDPWPEVDRNLTPGIDFSGDWRPWWADRIDEEVNNLLPEGRGDAFRMHVEGLGAAEIGSLIGVERGQVEDWNEWSGAMLSHRLKDVAEALGLGRAERHPVPLTYGMVRVSAAAGHVQGHDAGTGTAEHRLRELAEGWD